MKNFYIFLITLILSVTNLYATLRVTVAGGATLPHDGLTWAKAYSATELRDLFYTSSNEDIWIASGTYFPSTIQTSRFYIIHNLNIYGGFVGTETALSQRNSALNLTILSGNIGDPNIFTDNTNIIMHAVAENQVVDLTIDGITFDGNYNSPTLILNSTVFNINTKINNCIFKNMKAVAVRTNASIENNATGGLEAVLTVTNTVFHNNTGYSVLNITLNSAASTARATIINCTINNNTANADNTAGIRAHAQFSRNSFVEVINTVFWGNTGRFYITNTSFNTANFSDSIIEGSITNANLTNISAENPLFTNSAMNDYSLQNCSPAINKGNNTALPSTITTDLANNPRTTFGRIDYGAFEKQTKSLTKVFVSQTGDNSGGSSWTNAYTDLQDAMNNTCPTAEVWVAAGTYKPTTTTNRAIKFNIPSGNRIYGGFAGTETLLNQRNFGLNPTILSGNIGNQAINTDNSATVVNFNLVNNQTLLDGFTITDGYGVDGAGINTYAIGGISNPTIENCKVIKNTATNLGGGIMCNAFGGGNASMIIKNSLIAQNTGGGIVLEGRGTSVLATANLSLINCTVANNLSVELRLLSNSNAFSQVNLDSKNSIIWGSSISNQNGLIVAQNSNITGGVLAGTGNISANPQFINTALFDYGLGCTSPCFNAGNNTFFTGDLDIEAKTRIENITIDMGAYELYIQEKGFVKKNATGNNSGLTWANAFTDLQTALSQNCSISEIWVAAETYLPTATNDRSKTFLITNNSKIYGGFVGTETLLNQRNWKLNPTILSGEINTATNTDNVYHVVTFRNTGTNTLIDGFSVKDGYANGAGSPPYDDNGGGIFIDGRTGNTSNATITNCIIKNNFASFGGAGIYNNTYQGGTAILKLYNSLITENTAQYGVAVMNEGTSGTAQMPNCSSEIINCTIVKNVSTNTTNGVGGIQNRGLGSNGRVNSTIHNSVIWGNTSTNNVHLQNLNNVIINHTYSNIEGNGINSLNNLIDENPYFIDFANNNFTPNVCSPLLNKANASLLPVSVTKDLDFNNRITFTLLDIGTFEANSTVRVLQTGKKYFVKKTATGQNSGKDWTNAYTDLQSALGNQCQAEEVWVASETYKPTAGTNRAISFNILSNTKLYGGFVGNETLISQRNWALNPTILSGNIGDLNLKTDNSSHVIFFQGASDQTILDGFTIRDGNAEETTTAFPRFNDNGGGILNDGIGGSSKPQILNCKIINNQARYGGGGLYNIAIYGGRAEMNLTNCLVAFNEAPNGGAALQESSSHISILDTAYTKLNFLNCTIAKNSSNLLNGGILSIGASVKSNSKVEFKNSIIWHNEGILTKQILKMGSGVKDTSSFSNIQFYGAIPTQNSIDLDPQFIQADSSNFTLSSSSPSKDSGDNSALSATKDLNFNVRNNHATIDMGAYEYACMLNQVLAGSVQLNQQTIKDGATIKSTNTLKTTANYVLDAKKSVILEPGFNTESGAVFVAKVGMGCNN